MTDSAAMGAGRRADRFDLCSVREGRDRDDALCDCLFWSWIICLLSFGNVDFWSGLNYGHWVRGNLYLQKSQCWLVTWTYVRLHTSSRHGNVSDRFILTKLSHTFSSGISYVIYVDITCGVAPLVTTRWNHKIRDAAVREEPMVNLNQLILLQYCKF